MWPPSESLDVRLDIRSEVPTATERILAASLHLLGRIEWLDDDATATAIVSGRLPERVSVLAVRGMLGVLSCDRVLLHDAAGVTPTAFDDIAPPAFGAPVIFPTVDEELDAHEIVAGAGQGALFALVAAIEEAEAVGCVLGRRPVTQCSGATTRQVHCVGVDPDGMTLMRVDAGEVTVVYAAFFEPVHDTATLAAAVSSALAQGSIPARHPRI